MAGLDFEITSKWGERELLMQLLSRLELAGRGLGLEVNSWLKWDGLLSRLVTRKGRLCVSVGGALPALHALPGNCFSQLGAIATVMARPSAERRLEVLSRFLNAYMTALREAREAHRSIDMAREELDDEGWTIFSPSNIDFDAGSKSHLEESLRNLRLAMMQARVKRITSRSLVEECHSTVEHVMDAHLARTERRSLSYSEKVDALMARGIFDGVSEGDHIFGDIPCELKRLKNYRREAKHRGQAINHTTALRLATATVVAVNLLLAIIRKQDRERASAGALPAAGSRPS